MKKATLSSLKKQSDYGILLNTFWKKFSIGRRFEPIRLVASTTMFIVNKSRIPIITAPGTVARYMITPPIANKSAIK